MKTVAAGKLVGAETILPGRVAVNETGGKGFCCAADDRAADVYDARPPALGNGGVFRRHVFQNVAIGFHRDISVNDSGRRAIARERRANIGVAPQNPA